MLYSMVTVGLNPVDLSLIIIIMIIITITIIISSYLWCEQLRLQGIYKNRLVW